MGQNWMQIPAISGSVLGANQHHAFQHLNPSLLGAYSQPFAAKLIEGLADASAGMWAEKRRWAYDFGPNCNPTVAPSTPSQCWIMGDGTPGFPAGYERFPGTNRQFSYVDATSDPHLASQAFSNFFYRLRISNAVTNDRLIEFMLNTTRNVTDIYNDGYDLQDFKDALLRSVKTNEQALHDTIQQIWTAMDDTQPPVVVGPPQRPSWVGGNYDGCGTNPYTNYRLYWSPTENTTYYIVEYNVGAGTYTPIANPYAYHPIVTMLVGTQINSDLKVRACNQHGCSALSLNSLPVQDICY